jgi:hypothetical protein
MFSQGTTLKYFKRLKIYKNSTKSCQFNPETKYGFSYNWCFVRVIKKKLVFNEYNYSPTTSGHQAEMKRLLRELKIKIDVVVNTRSCLDDLRSSNYALKEVYRDLFLNELLLKRKSITAKSKNSAIDLIKHLKAKIKTLRSLGARFSKLDQKQLKFDVEKQENERLQDARDKRALVTAIKSSLKEDLNSLEAIDFKENEFNSLASL